MAAPRFAGFGPAVTDWFVALASDNSRSYWAATRDIWQRDVRDPLEALLEELAAEFGGRPKLFRPYRDMRYHSDAGPLKPQAGGLLLDIPGTASSRYVEVSADGFYAGAGMHRLEPDALRRYRQAAAGDAGALLLRELDAAEAAGLEVGGEALRGAPQGVPRDHPHLAVLRRKGVYLGATLPPSGALETRAPLEHAIRVWERAGAVCGWLDRHVGAPPG